MQDPNWKIVTGPVFIMSCLEPMRYIRCNSVPKFCFGVLTKHKLQHLDIIFCLWYLHSPMVCSKSNKCDIHIGQGKIRVNLLKCNYIEYQICWIANCLEICRTMDNTITSETQWNWVFKSRFLFHSIDLTRNVSYLERTFDKYVI